MCERDFKVSLTVATLLRDFSCATVQRQSLGEVRTLRYHMEPYFDARGGHNSF